MADDREARRAARRRLAPLYVADIVCRLGLLFVALLGGRAGHLSRTWALVLVVVFAAGLLVCGVIGRRMSPARRPPSPEAAAYRRMRAYVRQHHPLLYRAEIACWLSLGAAAIWQLSIHSAAKWASALWLVSLAGVFVCFVLMVRRDPEDRL